MKRKGIKIQLFLAVLFLITFTLRSYSQVRIGGNERPERGATLDLNNPSDGYVGGLLLPNVYINHVGYIPPSFTENAGASDKMSLSGMIVYNTNENLEGDNGDKLGKGIFLWDGEKWHSVLQRDDKDDEEYVGITPLPSEVPDLPDVDKYKPDTQGYAYIKGISCLSIEPGYNNTVDKKDNLYWDANRVQVYTLTGDTENIDQSSVSWRIVPKDYGSRDVGDYIDDIVISDDNMSCTIYYSDDAAQGLEDGIAELCPANKNGKCFVRVAIYAYYKYTGNSVDEKLIAQKTCYYQNYTCCNGFICEDCAYDYKNSMPGDWARVGNPKDNEETSLVKVYASGPWNDANNAVIDNAFLPVSAGDLCIYKKDAYIQGNWAAAILDCQDGDFTDGREDWGWYLPNLKEQKMIYIRAMEKSGLTLGQGYWWPDIFAKDLFGQDSDAEGLRHAGYFTSTETAQGNGGTHPTHTTIFNMGDGSSGTALKNLSGSAIKYRVRCVRRID